MRQTHQQISRFQPSWKLSGLHPCLWPFLLDGPWPHTPGKGSHGETSCMSAVICPCLLPFLWHHSQGWRPWLAQTPCLSPPWGCHRTTFPNFSPCVWGLQGSAQGWGPCFPSFWLTCPQRAARPRTLSWTKGTTRKQIQESSNNLHKDFLKTKPKE